MRLNHLALALSLAALGLPMSAMAQDDAAAASEESSSNLSWNFELTSDYVFRGITQTDFKPAAQGGLDYSFGDTGWYVGTWGSNVDFGAGSPDLEVDTYVGWNHDINEDWNFDVMIDRYNYLGYPNGADRFDYNEFIGKLAYKGMITFTAAYSDNYAQLDISETYFNLGGTWEIGNGFNFNAAIGRTDFSDGVPGYTDWNVGFSRQFGPMTAALGYYDTDVSGPKLSDRVVLTLSFGN
jgi:uncharacterized protein (TIGR02001 family)